MPSGLSVTSSIRLHRCLCLLGHPSPLTSAHTTMLRWTHIAPLQVPQPALAHSPKPLAIECT